MKLEIDTDVNGDWTLLDPANETDELLPHERNGMRPYELLPAVIEALAAGHMVTIGRRHARMLRSAGHAIPAGVVEV